jgi:hypothetical protein
MKSRPTIHSMIPQDGEGWPRHIKNLIHSATTVNQKQQLDLYATTSYLGDGILSWKIKKQIFEQHADHVTKESDKLREQYLQKKKLLNFCGGVGSILNLMTIVTVTLSNFTRAEVLLLGGI